MYRYGDLIIFRDTVLRFYKYQDEGACVVFCSERDYLVHTVPGPSFSHVMTLTLDHIWFASGRHVLVEQLIYNE